MADHRKILLTLGVLFLILAFVAHLSMTGPRTGELTLLTVADTSTGAMGGTANLRLEVRPGTGAIFIDSFPLTRIDTQASTRYAQQVACDHLDIDCLQYDFYYTIRANTAVVGGPSAGGAIAVLTAAVLADLPIDRSIAMTGTINSGGVIGPVAGVRAKIKGARQAGITTVLIPVLTGPENGTAIPDLNTSDAGNITDEELFGPLPRGLVPELAEPGVEVFAVGTLDEALTAFTGRDPSPAPAPLVPPPQYAERMRAIGDGLCARNEELRSQASRQGLAYEDTNNYTRRIAAVPASEGYARASLCFSQDVEIATIIARAMTPAQQETLARDVRSRIEDARVTVENTTLRTVGDLEVAAIVRERIAQAQSLLDGRNRTDLNASAADIAYANERVRSAQSWTALLGMPGAPLQMDEDRLRRTCLAKIAEADERISYVRVYAPGAVDSASESLRLAYASDSDPVLCILHAATAVADANLITGVIAVDASRVDDLVDEKLAAAERVLAERQAHGAFPILGYSYWQYASRLREDAPYSALTFAEQSLELATLDMYFPAERASWRLPPEAATGIVFFSYGAAFVVGIALLLWPTPAMPPKRRRHRR